ncbi:acyltransferase [Acinetobacter baumannii]|uniref:acyltransferase family protein n=2 Tax=Acinetobacter baumannii TaxID=470 RepID=UPI000450678A|nr:acyltransferase family protein [Acinetobacter baumannii]EXA59759.1 acyltransferase family protein [Acinetobacter baumannii 1035119]MDC5043856.1 acyltransferase [Acinetobacter baumannii]
MQFRYDINGLRAIAVLAVVIFHFTPKWLPGGFVGVDVFFVISGFLMTAIIFNSVQKNTFNLFEFYIARANRIIPVLATMSVVLLVFGWFYVLPTEYKDLGQQIEKGSLFTSNLLFAKGGGYFDTAEHTKWLLHTWSLSVEWQFYIFFPIVIIILKKYLSFKNIKHVIITLFLISFIYCIYATYKDSKTAYFLLTSRAWEMLLGGVAFLYPWSLKKKDIKIITQCLGLILILVSYFLISKDFLWPGYMAVIPVLGAYLIISSNYQNNIIISNPIFSYIGKWSYSIYVWHWPLVVFGFYFELVNWWIYGVLLSILLGFLSYEFIEKLKFTRYSSWREIYKVKPLYIFLFIFGCVYIIQKMDGFTSRLPSSVKIAQNEMQNSNPYNCKKNELYECVIGNKNNIRAIIIGDSHADSLTTSLASIFNLKSQGIISLTTSACPLITDIKFYSGINICSQINEERFKLINLKKYENIPIVLVARYPNYLMGENDPDRMSNNDPRPLVYFGNNSNLSNVDRFILFERNLKNTLCKISKKNPVYIIQPIPELGFNAPKRIIKNRFHNSNKETSISYRDYLIRSEKTRKIINRSAVDCGVTVLDPSKILCKTGKCISEYKGRPIYRDGDHLSEYGNKLLKPMFREALEKY